MKTELLEALRGVLVVHTDPLRSGPYGSRTGRMTVEDVGSVERLRAALEMVESGGQAESLGLCCNVGVVLLGPDGMEKDRREVHNLVVTAGKNKILLLAAAAQVNSFAYCAIGTGAVAAAITDTALGAEVARSAVITPTNPAANTLQFQNTFAAGVGTGAITEAGLLDLAAVGVLFVRQVFSVINKGAADTLQVTWSIT